MVSVQVQTLDQQGSPAGSSAPTESSTLVEQEPESNENDTPPSPWSQFGKKLSIIATVLAFVLGIGMVAPTVGQYATGVWSAAKDYRDWCKDEQVRLLYLAL